MLTWVKYNINKAITFRPEIGEMRASPNESLGFQWEKLPNFPVIVLRSPTQTDTQSKFRCCKSRYHWCQLGRVCFPFRNASCAFHFYVTWRDPTPPIILNVLCFAVDKNESHICTFGRPFKYSPPHFSQERCGWTSEWVFHVRLMKLKWTKFTF